MEVYMQSENAKNTVGHGKCKICKKLGDGGKNIYSAVSGCVKEIKDDVKAVKERDPAAKSTVEIVLTYSGLHAVLAYRVAHKLYQRGRYTTARMVSQTARFLTGIEIHPGATIGRGLFIDHGSGVVIGETAEIGDNCTLYQGVTLGGTGKDTGKRHPTLGNNVLVGSGAKVLGPFNVGDNSKVAANAVVLKEVPPNSTAVGIPAKIVVKNGEAKKPQNDLDQIHIPDPVSQELKKLSERVINLEGEQCLVPEAVVAEINRLTERIAALEAKLNEKKPTPRKNTGASKKSTGSATKKASASPKKTAKNTKKTASDPKPAEIAENHDPEIIQLELEIPNFGNDGRQQDAIDQS